MTKSKSKKTTVAVIGFNDGLAGQTAEWFEAVADFHYVLAI